MNIHQIYFSPTGGTRRVSESLCEGSNATCIATDLCVKAEEINLPAIKEDDLVIISMPVFGGRIPALAAERLKRIESNNARCAIVAVYGNRAYDDALLEMQDLTTEMGFRIIAAVSAIAEHSIARMYGNGRPDKADIEELEKFGKAIFEKVANDVAFQSLSLPGNRPYRKGSTGPFPEADDNCIECGDCAALCPAGAISVDNLKGTDKNLCIGCMRCVSVCQPHARGIGPALAMLTERLKPLCSDRKQNELFI